MLDAKESRNSEMTGYAQRTTRLQFENIIQRQNTGKQNSERQNNAIAIENKGENSDRFCVTKHEIEDQESSENIPLLVMKRSRPKSIVRVDIPLWFPFDPNNLLQFRL